MSDRRPIRKFMFKNLMPNAEESRQTMTYRGMRTVIRRTLSECGFTLTRPYVIVNSFDVMPDKNSNSITSKLLWAAFQVDSRTAKEIFEQRHGRNKQINQINKQRYLTTPINAKYLKLMQYKGAKYEAIKRTLWEACRLLSHQLPEEDGRKLKVVKKAIIIDNSAIQDKEPVPLTLDNLINTYPQLFKQAVRTLSEIHQMIMREIQLDLSTQRTDNSLIQVAPPTSSSPLETLRRAPHYPLTPPTVGPYEPVSEPSANVSTEA